jgi:hypothetical protein
VLSRLNAFDRPNAHSPVLEVKGSRIQTPPSRLDTAVPTGNSHFSMSNRIGEPEPRRPVRRAEVAAAERTHLSGHTDIVVHERCAVSRLAILPSGGCAMPGDQSEPKPTPRMRAQ